MIQTEIYIDKRRASLGSCIGKGGEGEVFVVNNDPASAVKIYTVRDAKEREEKIKAIIRECLAQKAPLVSFPTAIVRNKNGAFIGFAMKLISNHKPLHDLYAPGTRKHNFPQSDYRFLVRAAANISRAVASVHMSGCVIGDINHSSILISDRATAALIDADSFQITSGVKRFFCRVGVPEYTPPELQGRSLATMLRTDTHDCFGLAVVIFQLLFMGRHPFVGTVRKGDIPPLHEAIRDYRFVYAEGRNVGMDQPPGTPTLSDFSDEITRLFESAFSPNSHNGRPKASDWVASLERLEKSLVQCEKNNLHFFPRDASGCPWCEMESTVGTILFLPNYLGPNNPSNATDPGAIKFDIDQIWKQILSVKIPRTEEMLPQLGAFNISPSIEAEQAASNMANINWMKVGGLFIAGAIFVFSPSTWLLGVIIGGLALFAGDWRQRPKEGPFIARFRAIEQQWHNATADWHKRIGFLECIELRQKLETEKNEYKSLVAHESDQIEKYLRNRREHQLVAYLDNFEIQKAQIKGIGPSKIAALASFGIESAADISQSKLLMVPGFGPVNSQALVTWRKVLEQRFTFNPTRNQFDQKQIEKIRGETLARASALRISLVTGYQNIIRLVTSINSARRNEDPLLKKIHHERTQIKFDLKFLNIQEPSITFSQPAARTLSQPSASSSTFGTSHRSPGSGKTATNSTVVPSCPRCNSSMVRRVARRGRRAGNIFWGCSRYPTCRGTRNT